MFDYQIPKEYKYHHTATAKGYVSRKGVDHEALPYVGKFGTGYVVHTPRFDTTRYHYVTYYVLEEH